jgi:hypothetical protein
LINSGFKSIRTYAKTLHIAHDNFDELHALSRGLAELYVSHVQFKNIPQYHIRQQSLEIEDVIKQYFEFYKTIPMEILRNNIRTYAVPLYMVHKFVFFKILSLQLVPLRKS